MSTFENATPTVYAESSSREPMPSDYMEDVVEPIDEREIFGTNYSFPQLHYLFLLFIFIIIIIVNDDDDAGA